MEITGAVGIYHDDRWIAFDGTVEVTVRVNDVRLPICGEREPTKDGICIIMRYGARRHDCPCLFVRSDILANNPQIATNVHRRWRPDAWLDDEISV